MIVLALALLALVVGIAAALAVLRHEASSDRRGRRAARGRVDPGEIGGSGAPGDPGETGGSGGSGAPGETAGSGDSGFRLDLRGYRMDQVDDVVDRIEERIRSNAAEIAALRAGPPSMTDAGGPVGSAAATGAAPGSAASLATLARTTPTAVPPAIDPAVDPAVDLPTDPAVDPAVDPDEAPPPRRDWRDYLTGAAVPAHEREPAPADPAPRGRRWAADLGALAAYLLCSGYVLSGFLGQVRSGFLSQGVQDQQLFEWFLGATAHNVVTGSHPLASDLQNYPTGVNLMANTSVIGLGVPLTPLTRTLGSSPTFVLVELLGLALTAFAWYWVLVRRLHVGRFAAFVGAWLTGFGPGMVSHANGHLNFVAAFVLPLIVDRVIALTGPGRRTVRDGVVLGLLAAWQVLIGEELLVFVAVGLVVVGLVLVAHRRVDVRSMLPGLGVAALVSLVLVAWPLWWQFLGPQGVRDVWHPTGGNDLAALWGRATRTINADPLAAADLSMNRTEENAFFGMPLWLVCGAVVVLLWRRPAVRALAVLVGVSCWMSLGEEVTLHGEAIPVPALWSVLHRLPVIEQVLPSRFAMIALPAFGGLVAIGIDAAHRMSVDGRRAPTGGRAGGPPPPSLAALAGATLLAAVALLPVVPTPLVVEPRHPVPAFFATGQWQRWVHGGSVLAVSPTDIGDARGLEWQEQTGMAFPLVEGYFVGPDAEGDGGGTYGAVRRPMSQWLLDIRLDNTPALPTAAQRRQFIGDLRAWRTDVVVLPPRPEADALAQSLVPLLGQPTEVGGVTLWDVRALRERGT